MKTFITLLASIALMTSVVAQNNSSSNKSKNTQYPTVGQPCPDFVLQHIEYYPKKTATLKNFRGKWLLLDFWNRACMACIASFPHISELQKQLGDKVQVMMVGIQDPERQVNLIYSKYREKEHLVMPCAFDSALAHRFDILIAPYSILIDDKGIVQCITSTVHIDDMKAFLAGEHPSLPKMYRMSEDHPVEELAYVFNAKKPFAINNNGGADSDFLFRTVLTKWKQGRSPWKDPASIEMAFREDTTSFYVLGIPLADLYSYAYLSAERSWLKNMGYGQYYEKVILEVRDSSLFQYSFRKGTNLFCYSVNQRGSKLTVEKVRMVMQKDLENYFGYAVKVEKRKISCWKLTATEEVRVQLKTKGAPPFFKGNARVGYMAGNFPFTTVVSVIRANNEDYFFDETGITGNVDIEVSCEGCVLTDAMDVKKALEQNGIKVERTEKEMEVLVIRDAATPVSVH